MRHLFTISGLFQQKILLSNKEKKLELQFNIINLCSLLAQNIHYCVKVKKTTVLMLIVKRSSNQNNQ